jgi:hypothetical protein
VSVEYKIALSLCILAAGEYQYVCAMQPQYFMHSVAHAARWRLFNARRGGITLLAIMYVPEAAVNTVNYRFLTCQ